MGGIAVKQRSARGLVAALVLLCLAPVLSACASTSYMRIPFAAGAADPELQSLARRAQAGDKHAQLELGIRYEEGRGVPVDLEQAERLYRAAASDSGGTTYVYSPPLRRGGSGRVMSLRRGTAVRGLEEARVRMERLELLRDGRAVKRVIKASVLTAGTTTCGGVTRTPASRTAYFAGPRGNNEAESEHLRSSASAWPCPEAGVAHRCRSNTVGSGRYFSVPFVGERCCRRPDGSG